MTTITSSDPNLEFRNEYDIFKEVFYNQEPFTGLLKDENEETEFLNGNAHGKYIAFFKDGLIHTEAFFQNGEEIESISFYQSGKKSLEENQIFSKMWNENEQLISESNFIDDTTKNYFSNGNIKSVYDGKNEEWSYKFYTRNGDLVMTVLAKNDNISYNSGVIFENNVLFENYFDLLFDENPELEFQQSYQSSENHRIHLIWMWFWNVFDKDQKEYFSIVNQLMKHPNKKVIEIIANIIAIHKFEPYIENENVFNKDCYSFIKSDREYQNKHYPNRDFKKVFL